MISVLVYFIKDANIKLQLNVVTPMAPSHTHPPGHTYTSINPHPLTNKQSRTCTFRAVYATLPKSPCLSCISDFLFAENVTGRTCMYFMSMSSLKIRLILPLFIFYVIRLIECFGRPSK